MNNIEQLLAGILVAVAFIGMWIAGEINRVVDKLTDLNRHVREIRFTR